MRRIRARRLLVLTIAAVPLVCLAALVPWILTQSRDAPAFNIELVDPDPADVSVAARDEERFSAEEQLVFGLRQESESARVATLDVFLNCPEARSDFPELRSRMLTDRSRVVRVRAFEVARDLAIREGRHAVTQVLADAIRNPNPDVKREGLRSCVKHPRYELFADLMAVASASTSERFLAVQALAFLDEPAAQKKVLEMAKSEDVPRPERLRAIALLSQTSLPASAAYLKELAASEDAELQRVAFEALAALQTRQERNGSG